MDWCPRVNPPLGMSGSGCRSPGTTSAACRVHLGAYRCTLVGLRLPPGPNFQALLPVKLLSISTPSTCLRAYTPTSLAGQVLQTQCILGS